jgi:hypothetical protein
MILPSPLNEPGSPAQELYVFAVLSIISAFFMVLPHVSLFVGLGC